METRSKSETKSEKEDERSNSERFPKNFFFNFIGQNGRKYPKDGAEVGRK